MVQATVFVILLVIPKAHLWRYVLCCQMLYIGFLFVTNCNMSWTTYEWCLQVLRACDATVVETEKLVVLMGLDDILVDTRWVPHCFGSSHGGKAGSLLPIKNFRSVIPNEFADKMQTILRDKSWILCNLKCLWIYRSSRLLDMQEAAGLLTRLREKIYIDVLTCLRRI